MPVKLRPSQRFKPRAQRRKRFCSMCAKFWTVWEMRHPGEERPINDPNCGWCGGYGVIPYRWRKGDPDRRRGERRKKRT